MSRKLKSQAIYRVNHLPGETPESIPEQSIRHSFQQYDEQGNLLREVSFTQDGSLADKNEFRYDAQGRMVETLIYDEDDAVMERRLAERDSSGRLLREQVHYLDGSVDTYHYHYDEQGRLTGLEVIDDEEATEYKEMYSYQDDKLVKTERCDERGNVTFRIEDIYADGILTERRTWSDEESEPFTLVQKFNERGVRTQELRYNGQNELIERNIYEDDGTGKVVQIIEENKQRKNTTGFRFDDQGRMIYQAEHDLNGELNHEVFRTYNDDGNILSVTVEMVQKPSGMKLAYTLLYQYEYF